MANPFLGIEVAQVGSGTVIEHEGEEEIVSDTNAVFKGRKMFVTPRVFEKIKSHSKEPS